MSRGRALALALLLMVPAGAQAGTNWERYRDIQTVQVITRQEDGSARDTTVWLVVVDGEPYLRTSNTRWAGDLERDPNATLEVEGAQIPVKVTFVQDEATRDKAILAFREKYGFTDRVLGVFRFGGQKVIRLEDR